jgi:hypothetical protein
MSSLDADLDVYHRGALALVTCTVRNPPMKNIERPRKRASRRIPALKKLLGITMAVAIGSACGGSPTAPVKQTPSANITAFGQMTQFSCAFDTCDTSQFSLRNNGPGCASTTDLSGTVTVVNAAGVTVGTAEWELTLGSKALGVFRPDAELQANVGRLPWLSGTNNVQVRITKQTNIPCN